MKPAILHSNDEIFNRQTYLGIFKTAFNSNGAVVAESIINIFCPCAIMSAVSGYWHISLIAMGGIAK